MEVSKKAYKDFYRAKEREEYVGECRDDVVEDSFEVLKEQNNEDMNDSSDSTFEAVLKEMTLEKNIFFVCCPQRRATQPILRSTSL